MVEDLTEKNLRLGEEVTSLRIQVKGLTELQEANEEIGYIVI